MKQQYSSYMAFLSHSRSDAEEARIIQRFIEAYRIPLNVQREPMSKRALKRLAPVSLDRSDLSAVSDLTTALARAIRASKYLIVLCSEKARDSAWVKMEIVEFLKCASANRVIYIVSEHVEADLDCKSLLPLGLSGGTEPVNADRRLDADGLWEASLGFDVGGIE